MMTEKKMQVFNINLPRGAGLSSTKVSTGRQRLGASNKVAYALDDG